MTDTVAIENEDSIKFKKHDLVDKILIALIKTHHEVKNIDEFLNNSTIERESLAERKFRKKVRRQELAERVFFLSGLLVA